MDRQEGGAADNLSIIGRLSTLKRVQYWKLHCGQWVREVVHSFYWLY